MAKTFAALVNEIQSDLGDDTTTYTDAKVTIQLEKALKKVSEHLPYVRKVSYFIESRTGTATTDTADALVDTTENQFLTTDADKVIHNTQNNTWAVVSDAQYAVSDDKLVLSKDIMVDGDEKYEMYNEGCTSKYQINIEDVTDWVGSAKHGIIAVEYPIGTKRNFIIDGDILTILVDSVSDSKVADPATDTEVLVWFETRQRVSQLVDLAGTVNGTVLAGATTFTIAAVGSGSEVIAEDTLFTFYLFTVRGTYKIKYDLTLSGGGGTIVFWPGLESAPANGAIVVFIGSTLNSVQERLVVELAAAYCGLALQADAISKGGQAVYNRYLEKREKAIAELRSLQKPRTKHSYPRD
ncbi:hypothetical protein LCGC14_0416640 [marine sediment metagenome]|uniref:Uncharacterized protein n=1 Tax=marine sediment metagenome TaxID=412755 RepID=A0A0F9SS71_9ZZZZ